MEINDTPAENEKLDKVARVLIKFASFVLWHVCIYWLVYQENYSNLIFGIYTVIWIIFGWLIFPGLWNIANIIRLWIKPDIIVSSNAREAFNNKIFWLIGPQSIAVISGTLIISIVSAFGVEYFLKTPSGDGPEETVIQGLNNGQVAIEKSNAIDDLKRNDDSSKNIDESQKNELEADKKPEPVVDKKYQD